MFLFPEAAEPPQIFINRISLKNVARVRERFVPAEKREEERMHGGLVAHQHSKYSGRRRVPLFGTEEEQKPPERGGCCINIYTGKEGLA